MVCDVGEGTVHRLWEPLAAKQTPANGYAGKFSTPYCIAAGLRARQCRAWATSPTKRCAIRRWSRWRSKVRYRIDPQNPYPREFTGHIRATLNDGRVIEERQPHFRGGAKEPLTRADIEDKFVLNVPHGGWDEARARRRARAAAQALRRQDRSLAAAGVVMRGLIARCISPASIIRSRSQHRSTQVALAPLSYAPCCRPLASSRERCKADGDGALTTVIVLASLARR